MRLLYTLCAAGCCVAGVTAPLGKQWSVNGAPQHQCNGLHPQPNNTQLTNAEYVDLDDLQARLVKITLTQKLTFDEKTGKFSMLLLLKRTTYTKNGFTNHLLQKNFNI